ncbi:hypothetical protein DRJ17_04665 [Candidatus Woesearchaeota archaeon]|nr:MAG: hypothetical protein DRJ17_04665 [Candidatus Woesearchaeota archaeon]
MRRKKVYAATPCVFCGGKEINAPDDTIRTLSDGRQYGECICGDLLPVAAEEKSEFDELAELAHECILRRAWREGGDEALRKLLEEIDEFRSQ